VSSSAAPHAIITVEKLKPHLAARRGRPLIIIDIAVPRDVEPEVANLQNVYLFDIDDLQQVTEKYRKERAKEAQRVETMVEEETRRFMRWLGAREVAPLINDLRGQTEALRDAELERWLRRAPDLNDALADVMRQMMRSFANKLLHAPLRGLRELSGSESAADLVAFTRQLFDLEAERENNEEDGP
jgi:glutamyl-tRNA reductase